MYPRVSSSSTRPCAGRRLRYDAQVTQRQGNNYTAYRGKRAFDCIVLALAAVPSMLIGAAVSILVKLTSKGPVIFRQNRVGKAGEIFVLLKFRTMYHDPDRRPTFPDSNSITPIGRVLRRLSLDELPQLLNVAKGEMSVVGPRPPLAYQVARYDERQSSRLAVLPGLTGLAQLRGRNGIPWGERIEHDLEYIKNQSPWLDLRILTGSFRNVVLGIGTSGQPRDDPIAKQ